MNVEIISERLTHKASESSAFGQGTLGEVTLRNWRGVHEGDLNPDVLVIDLNLHQLTDSISFVSGSQEESLSSAFKALEREIPLFLESGGVVIALLAGRTAFWQGNDEVDTLGWLDQLNIVEIIRARRRHRITVFDKFPAVERYFNYVDYYEWGIRLNEELVTKPEILAKHSVDNEMVAVTLREFSNIEEENVSSDGRLILLPQPTTLEPGLIGFLQSLKQIGEFYHEGSQFYGVEVPNDDPFVDMEYILKRGETETVEYKGELPSHVNNLAKEFVALANHRGGVVALGVEDSGKVTGLDDIHQVEERVSQLAQTKIEPPLYPRVEKERHNSQDVLLVRIHRQGALHSMDGKFYVRVGTTIDKLNWRQIKNRMTRG